MTLPKYVIVAGAQLVSVDPGNPKVPHGTYIPVPLPNGNIRLANARVIGPEFTVHRDVWPVAIADFRISAL